MIYVQRPEPPPQKVLEALAKPLKPRRGAPAPPGPPQTELEAARLYYAVLPRPTKAYEFRRYKEEDVCQALDTLFHLKCAYCETRYSATDSRDVEHFRPKAGIDEAPAHPGYWWLAAKWSNLLPSCPPCNQRRKHVAFDLGMTLEEVERALIGKNTSMFGKANAFPVLGKNWVTQENGDLALEDPLLINPCERQPDQHLEWVIDWEKDTYLWEADTIVPLVRPRATAAGTDDEYAKASIAIYGLNRLGIVRERMARAKDMQRLLPPIVDVITDLSKVADPTAPANQPQMQKLTRYRALLYQFTDAAQEYAGMARAFVKAFDRELTRFQQSLPPAN